MTEVFLKIVNMSISAGWLILVVLLLRLLLKNAPKGFHYIFWALVAIRLVCPISFESVLSLIPSAETVPRNITYTQTPEIQSGITTINNVVNPMLTESMVPNLVNSANPIQIVAEVATGVWIIGVVGMLVYMLISYLRLQGKVRISINVKENTWICDNIQSPFILGVISPRIYLPSDINENEIPYIVAHEKEHLRYHDNVWKPLGFIILAVHWFNPFVWISYILMCKDMELACDERVIKGMDNVDKKTYSEVLFSCSSAKRVITACPVAFGEVGIKQRIKSVFKYKKSPSWIVALSVVMCIIVGICFLTNPEEKIVIDDLEIVPGEPIHQGAYKQYTFSETEEPMRKATLLLYEQNKTYQFTYSLLSSSIPIGKYYLDDEKLILKDNEYIYTFKVVGDSFVFDAENSARIPEYRHTAASPPETAVPDGAIFELTYEEGGTVDEPYVYEVLPGNDE